VNAKRLPRRGAVADTAGQRNIRRNANSSIAAQEALLRIRAIAINSRAMVRGELDRTPETIGFLEKLAAGAVTWQMLDELARCAA
jgi:hypothetical protein